MVQKFEYDVWYVDNVDFFLDLRIIMRTLKKVFFREDITQLGQVIIEAFKGN